jgi:cob(I)alamin adenosyltransferase
MKGLIQVYTGDGKGKTTAAFGQAVRAAGRGFNVAIVQFFKARKTGELTTLANVENIHISRATTNTKFTWEMNQEELDALDKEIADGFKMIHEMMVSGKYDILIVDEFNHVLNRGHVSQEQMEAFLKDKPDTMELILTGRNAPVWMIEKADLVTEMRYIKHPMVDAGLNARRGIEY